jgi:flagellar biosynthesis GTPase FlhF
LLVVVGTSLKIPGTKRIVRESINAVHHTPRGKAIWINLDPPPSKNFDIWIKGDCQRIPGLYEDFERVVEQEKVFNEMKLKRKEEEKAQAERDRHERKERERTRKEENERIRQQRKEEKEVQRVERERKEEERKKLKASKEAKKARNALQAAIRPVKQIKKEEKSWSRPLTPPSSYDTDSTLSSPSLSDIEFASFVESENKTLFPTTPSVKRVFEYLPTPASTPQKGLHDYPEQDSPLKNKKMRMNSVEEMKRELNNNHVMSGQHRNSMSIKFLTE